MTEKGSRLEGKVAIVTGGSSGIGRGVALSLAGQGAAVVVGDIIKAPREGGRDTVSEIQASGGKGLFIETDVAQERSIVNLVDSAVKHFGKLDIMVNNAGINIIKPVHELTGEEFARIMDINVKGVFLGCKYALEHMTKQNSGKIINMASNFSFTALGNICAYVTSKAAVLGMTKALAIEFAPLGINVNAICPGATKTEFTRPFWGNTSGMEELEKRTPLRKNGEFMVSPSDIGKTAVFLASDDSDMMTGTSILVDGGWNAW